MIAESLTPKPGIRERASKHGSWLNLVEGFFSKLARSILRHIRVSSKQELKQRLMAAVHYGPYGPGSN
jgi:transposase